MTLQQDTSQLADNVNGASDDPSAVVLETPEVLPLVEEGAGPVAVSAAPAAPVTEPVTTEPAPVETPVVETLFDLPDELKAQPEEPQGFSGADRQELERLRQERTEVLQVRQEQQRTEELNQLERHYVDQYQLDPATAKLMANEVRTERQRGEVAVNNAQMQSQVEVARRECAQTVGKELGVSPTALIGCDSRREMTEKGTMIRYMAQQAKTFEDRIGKLEKRGMPENTNYVTGAGNEVVTADNIDALFMRHESDHPGRVNPYEEQYRRFLNK